MWRSAEGGGREGKRENGGKREGTSCFSKGQEKEVRLQDHFRSCRGKKEGKRGGGGGSGRRKTGKRKKQKPFKNIYKICRRVNEEKRGKRKRRGGKRGGGASWFFTSELPYYVLFLFPQGSSELKEKEKKKKKRGKKEEGMDGKGKKRDVKRFHSKRFSIFDFF